MAPTTNNKIKFSYCPVSRNFCPLCSDMMIFNLSESLVKPLVMAKLNMSYLSSLKKPSKTAVVFIAGVTISGTPCPWHIIVPIDAEAISGHVGPGRSNPTSSLRPALTMAPTTDNKLKFLLGPVSQNSCARRSVMMILNSPESLAKPLVIAELNTACLSSLKKPSKAAAVLIAGVTISGSQCPWHITVPFEAETPSGHVAQA